MLGGVHQREGHRQRIGHQHRSPAAADLAPQEDRDHRGQRGVQRGDRGDQIDAGLAGVDQRSGRLQMQRSPAAGRDPFDELIGPGPAGVHCTQQPAVGDTCGAPIHALRAGRATNEVGPGATGGGPRRRGRQHDVHGECGERQCDESADERRPLASVAQPQHSRDDVRQHEERHVDAADDHFPPRRLRHLDVLLEPHRRHRTEEQPAVGVGLKLPEGGCAQERRRPTAEVVEHQHQREGQPIPNDREHCVSAPDARGEQAGGDVDQQQCSVEGQSVRHAAVGHHQRPGRDRHPSRDREPAFAAARAGRAGQRRSMWRHAHRPACAGAQFITLGQPDSAIGCY